MKTLCLLLFMMLPMVLSATNVGIIVDPLVGTDYIDILQSKLKDNDVTVCQEHLSTRIVTAQFSSDAVQAHVGALKDTFNLKNYDYVILCALVIRPITRVKYLFMSVIKPSEEYLCNLICEADTINHELLAEYFYLQLAK